MATKNYTLKKGDIDESRQQMDVWEYINLAESNGFKYLRDLSIRLMMPHDRLYNLCSGRVKVTDFQKRYFYLDAKARGWV